MLAACTASIFRVDYLKLTGAIGFYHPDWVVIQKVSKKEINWIIETKGRVWPGTSEKYESITDWCERTSASTGSSWRFAVVNHSEFEGRKFANLEDVVKGDHRRSLIE